MGADVGTRSTSVAWDQFVITNDKFLADHLAENSIFNKIMSTTIHAHRLLDYLNMLIMQRKHKYLKGLKHDIGLSLVVSIHL